MQIQVDTPERVQALIHLVEEFSRHGKNFADLVQSDPEQAQEYIDQIAEEDSDE